VISSHKEIIENPYFFSDLTDIAFIVEINKEPKIIPGIATCSGKGHI